MSIIPDYLLPPSMIPQSSEAASEAAAESSQDRQGGKRRDRHRGHRDGDQGAEEGQARPNKYAKAAKFQHHGKGGHGRRNDPLRSFRAPSSKPAASSS